MAVTQAVESALSGPSPEGAAEAMVQPFGAAASRAVLYGAALIILMSSLFTYVITRIALLPTREALESQKRFIGNIAHELRTPLSIIKTNTEVRLLDSDVPSVAVDLYRENLEELDRVSDIINNLLSLSGSLQPGRLAVREVDLGPLVDGVLARLRPLAERKALEIEVRVSERRTVLGNPTALEQIIMNLVRNAISYTEEGRISVIIEPVFPDLMELVVQDTGRGIARKDLHHIFEPFYRADPARSRGQGNSGLGLAIVSELVRFHSGKITVRSAPGRGTTITVLLPAGRASLAIPEEEGEHKEDVGEVIVDFLNGGYRA